MCLAHANILNNVFYQGWFVSFEVPFFSAKPNENVVFTCEFNIYSKQLTIWYNRVKGFRNFYAGYLNAQFFSRGSTYAQANYLKNQTRKPMTFYGLLTLQQSDIIATVLKMQFKNSCEFKNCTQKRVLSIKKDEATVETQKNFQVNPCTQNIAVTL